MEKYLKGPLLCLCIPIYNRQSYLIRMLDRFLEDADLFDDNIELLISDNCSQEDLESICENYKKRGLKLLFHRNEENLGSNGNFLWCFNNGKCKYLWLLGSDDIPKRGVLRKIVSYLNNNDYGLVHLSINPREKELNTYFDANEMAVAVSYWITFMSSNIILTSTLNPLDLLEYKDTWIVQVPAYLNACLVSPRNAVLYFGYPFEKENDNKNNGGYNLFQVFIENLFLIYNDFVNKGLLSKQAFEKIKKDEYRRFLLHYIVNYLIFKKSQKHYFDLDNSWSILFKHYGRYFYAYYYLLEESLIKITKGFVNFIHIRMR